MIANCENSGYRVITNRYIATSCVKNQAKTGNLKWFGSMVT